MGDRRIPVRLDGHGPQAFAKFPQELLALLLNAPWKWVADMKIALAIAAAQYQDAKHAGEPVQLSNQQIIDATGIDPRHLRRRIRALEELGAITVTGSGPGGRGHTKTYALNYQPEPEKQGRTSPPLTQVEKGGRTRPPLGQETGAYTPPFRPVNGGVQAPLSNSHKEGSKEPSKKAGGAPPGADAPGYAPAAHVNGETA